MHVTRLVATDAARYRQLMLHAYEVAADAFTSTPDERAAEPDSWWMNRIADPRSLSASFGAFRVLSAAADALNCQLAIEA